MNVITHRQRVALHEIIIMKDAHGYPPTVRELKAKVIMQQQGNTPCALKVLCRA